MPHPTARPTGDLTRPPAPPLRHLTQLDLARRWRMSPRTLERWRSLDQGPAYLKLGAIVVYPEDGVEAFEATQRHEPAGTSRSNARGGA